MKNFQVLFIILSLVLLQSACGKKEKKPVVEAPKVCTNTCKAWQIRTDYPDCKCVRPEYKLPDAQLQAQLIKAALKGDLRFITEQVDKNHINPDAYLGLSEMDDLLAFRESLSRNKALYNSIKKTTNDLTLAALAASDKTFGSGILQMLAEREADFNKPVLGGKTVLEMALEAGNTRVLPLLLKNGAKGDLFSGNRNYLQEAINNNNTALTTALVDYAIANNIDLSSVLPSLEEAIKGKSKELVTLLIDKTNPDPNQLDSKGNPLIVTAALNGKKDFITMLLLAGADINLTNDKGQTPLMALISQATSNTVTLSDMVTFFIVNGADLSLVDLKGENVIFYAVRTGNEPLIKNLIAQGADINARNAKGDSPLFKAVEADNQKMVKFLLQNGASPRLTNRNKVDASTLAAQLGFMDTYDIIESYK